MSKLFDDFVGVKLPDASSSQHWSYRMQLDKKAGDEPLQLWLSGKFYVDLPEDRYLNAVEVDWMAAQEWKDGPWQGLYVAQCRVRPNPDSEWELFAMQRAEDDKPDSPRCPRRLAQCAKCNSEVIPSPGEDSDVDLCEKCKTNSTNQAIDKEARFWRALVAQELGDIIGDINISEEDARRKLRLLQSRSDTLDKIADLAADQFPERI